MQPTNPERLTFLVYIWRECKDTSEQNSASTNLVQIVCLANGETRYFASPEEMGKYIQAYWLEPAQNPWEKK